MTTEVTTLYLSNDNFYVHYFLLFFFFFVFWPFSIEHTSDHFALLDRIVISFDLEFEDMCLLKRDTIFDMQRYTANVLRNDIP